MSTSSEFFIHRCEPKTVDLIKISPYQKENYMIYILCELYKYLNITKRTKIYLGTDTPSLFYCGETWDMCPARSANC